MGVSNALENYRMNLLRYPSDPFWLLIDGVVVQQNVVDEVANAVFVQQKAVEEVEKRIFEVTNGVVEVDNAVCVVANAVFVADKGVTLSNTSSWPSP